MMHSFPIVIRFGFAYYAYHGGGPAVARFSAQHDLSGSDIWTTALVLMAFGQVLARLAVLQIRRVRAARDQAALGYRQALAPPAGGQPVQPAADRAGLVPSWGSAHDRIHARRQQRRQARREARGWG
jgi:hypothetical protein